MSKVQSVDLLQKVKILFWMSSFFLFVHSSTFVFMPIALEKSEQSLTHWRLRLTGIVFWISLIVGYVLLYFANKTRKQFVTQKLHGDLSMGCRIGVFNFFSNLPAIIADALAVISIIILIVIFLTGESNGFFTFIMSALLILSLNMHCLFNGRIYKTTNFRRIRREKDYA